MAQVTEEEISAEIQHTIMRAYLRYIRFLIHEPRHEVMDRSQPGRRPDGDKVEIQ